MMKKHLYLLFFFVLLATGIMSCDRKPVVTEADYERAESFLRQNIAQKIYHLEVSPNWLKADSGFWYLTHTRQGKRFFVVNWNNKTTKEAFDHQSLAQSLSEASGRTVKADSLPFNQIDFSGKDTIRFTIADTIWNYDLLDHKLDFELSENKPGEQGILSPDGKWKAFTRNYNLYIRNTKTGREKQLSRDGKYQYEYGSHYGWGDIMEGENGKRQERLFVNWSPDSKKTLTQVVDLSQAEKMYLLNFSIDSLFRPQLLSYYRGSPGDTTLVYYKPVIFELESNRTVWIDVPKTPHFIGFNAEWSEDGKNIVGQYRHRGFKEIDFIEVNPNTGKVRKVFSESDDISIEYGMSLFQKLKKSNNVLLTSQRDGWSHIYLYDWEKGDLINQVTQGEYVVKNILHVDENKQVIYFVAGGKEKDRNPYFNHLYKVGFDGSGLELLTPEKAHHQVSLSPCKKYIVDNFSKPDKPTQSVLRKLETGDVIMEISEADTDDLAATGWNYPLSFTVKARDGVTDIYGAIWRPTNFNPRKKYPIIDYTYTGPHASITPKSFSDAVFNIIQPLAEFGFVVMVVDGLGTAQRSKEFRSWSYNKLGDGVIDHVVAIRQLAEQYKWIDTTRVGIYGHSAGGYDATRAMLMFPDFYKVGVSSAADHDHRMEKAWWPEMYMGYPVGEFYHEQSNVTNAHNLKGKLLMAHGAIDENVNPSATYKMAEMFIREGIDFDMLILPSSNHSFGRQDGDYFTKVRWNYFIKHLLGAEPVHNYRFKTIDLNKKQ